MIAVVVPSTAPIEWGFCIVVSSQKYVGVFEKGNVMRARLVGAATWGQGLRDKE